MRSKTRKNRSSSKTKRKSRKIAPPVAGEAIAAGGFGCVFRPPIKCKNPSDEAKQKSKNYITKLMKNRYVVEEMDEVDKYLPIIKTIPGYKNYFLLDDIFPCVPGELTSSDKKGLDSKCGNLRRLGINAANINQPRNLLGLSMLNIPDGGTSIARVFRKMADKITRNNKETFKQFGHLNNSLIRTLQNAVVPMNTKGIIHCDLKADNMLVDETKLGNGEPYVKVIDWGLGSVFNPNSSTIPGGVKDRPISFNNPFGVILFNTYEVRQAINVTHAEHPGNQNYRYMAYNILKKCNSVNGPGHTEYVTQYIMPDLVKPYISFDLSNLPEGFKNNNVESVSKTVKMGLFSYNVIIDHLEEVLKKYFNSSTKKFDEKAYFFDVYRWNVDVWGFLTSYMQLAEDAATNSYTKYRNSKIIQTAADVAYKYCLSGDYAAKRIPIAEVVSDLQRITEAIPGFKSKGIIREEAQLRDRMRELEIAAVPGELKVKKKKIKMKLKAKSHTPSVVSIPAGKKRCPTGYAKDAATGKCRKKGTKKVAKKVAKKATPTRKVAKAPTGLDSEFSILEHNGKIFLKARDKTRRRCPKGYKKVRISSSGHLICEKK